MFDEFIRNLEKNDVFIFEYCLEIVFLFLFDWMNFKEEEKEKIGVVNLVLVFFFYNKQYRASDYIFSIEWVEL